MKVELSRVRVKPGKSDRVTEWMEMLNSRMPEALQTLDREEMKIEVIFREVIEDHEYLYWFSVQGEHGAPVTTSPFDIDAKHIEFSKECLDRDYRRRDAQPQVVMVQKVIAEAMEWDRPWESAKKFEKPEGHSLAQ